MRINKKIYLLLSVALLTACNEVKEGDRLVYEQPAPSQRAVLVEDFTGQKCVNCPDATKEIEEMVKQYGEDKVIAVAIHGGGYGVSSTSKSWGLATPETAVYYDHWKITSQPAGLINRVGGIMQKEKWMTALREQIGNPSPVTFERLNAYVDASDNETGHVDIGVISSQPMTAKLQVWLVEDSIIAPQSLEGNVVNTAYIHNHVFRQPVNGSWGEEITFGTNMVTKTYTYSLLSKYNLRFLSLVAFVYDDENGVYQVCKQHLVTDK